MQPLSFESWKNQLLDIGLNPNHSRWLVAVSGGVDSAVLLHLCGQLIPYYGTHVVAVHCDHRLRGDVGKGESHLISQWCERAHIPFALEELDVEHCASDFKLSTQEAARMLRRRALLALAAKHDCSHILTAHHSSDAVEWFLMKLFRGAGTDGLSGFKPLSGVWVKTLLSFSRDHIRDYARAHGISFIEDPSNDENVYFRNRVRNELIPYLDGFCGHKVEPALQRVIENLREDSHTLRHLAQMEFDRWAIHRGSEIQIPLARLTPMAPSLRRRIYQLAFNAVHPRQEGHDVMPLERRHIELIDLCQRECELPLGVHIHKTDSTLSFFKETLKVAADKEGLPSLLEVPGVTDLRRFSFRCVSSVQSMAPHAAPWKEASPFSAFIDWSKVRGNIRVRRVRDNDVMEVEPGRVAGCLSLLKKAQIPKRLREEALVFEDESGIIWLAPYRVNARAWVGPETRIVLKFQLRPNASIGKNVPDFAP